MTAVEERLRSLHRRLLISPSAQEDVIYVLAELTALRERVSQLEADAGRYRYLREWDWIDEAIMERKNIVDGDPQSLDDAIDLDVLELRKRAAIDAAMKERGELG